ncbi:MAG TPA: hypothetical protein VNH11_23255 [Pirellulales bacterium]|nr:hypothetical protein [Pirellulales bacterium]
MTRVIVDDGLSSTTPAIHKEPPPTVTITESANATKGGDAGEFAVSRTGPTESALAVNYTAIARTSRERRWKVDLRSAPARPACELAQGVLPSCPAKRRPVAGKG